jgi:hypothetical protein
VGVESGVAHHPVGPGGLETAISVDPGGPGIGKLLRGLEQPSSLVPNPQSIDPFLAMLQYFLDLCLGQTTFLRSHLLTVMAQNTSYKY